MTRVQPPSADELAAGARRRRERWHRGLREGEPTLARQFARVGVLGWMIVVPALAGVFVGRWLDRSAGTGVFCTAPLLLLGLAAGCRAAWKWMHDA
jgi:ATP synthase protein I